MGVNLAIELEDRVNGNGRHGVLIDAPMAQEVSDAEAVLEDTDQVSADAESVVDRTDETPAGTQDEQPEQDEETARLAAVVESMLLASGASVPLVRLTEALDGPERREVVAALRALGDAYEREGRGLRLVYVAGGYQLRSAPEHGHWVRRLLGGRPPRLSRPMLETLAIVAYRQPCTRPEIEAIRGVDADAVLATLLERRLIRIQGRKDAPGRPILYGTTKDFLEVFGLPDLHALPALGELGEGAEALMSRVEASGDQDAAEASSAPDAAPPATDDAGQADAPGPESDD
jgi:segregation and condensation protein B